jgi:hypothetical protein
MLGALPRPTAGTAIVDGVDMTTAPRRSPAASGLPPRHRSATTSGYQSALARMHERPLPPKIPDPRRQPFVEPSRPVVARVA